MALEHVRAVCEGSVSKSPDRHVLSTIATRINSKSQTAWPSITTIAQECGCSTRHVKNAIPRLEALEELIVRRGESAKSTHVYSLGPKLQALANLFAGRWRVNAVHPGGAHHADAGEPRAPVAVNVVHPNINSSIKETSSGEGPEEQEVKGAAHQVVQDLRRAGIPNPRVTQQLLHAIALGARTQELLTAIHAAPPTAGDRFAYGVKVALNRLQAAPKLPCKADSWDDAPRSVVEAKGEETGIGKWDEREHWPEYKARVAIAAREKEVA